MPTLIHGLTSTTAACPCQKLNNFTSGRVEASTALFGVHNDKTRRRRCLRRHGNMDTTKRLFRTGSDLYAAQVEDARFTEAGGQGQGMGGVRGDCEPAQCLSAPRELGGWVLAFHGYS